MLSKKQKDGKKYLIIIMEIVSGVTVVLKYALKLQSTKGMGAFNFFYPDKVKTEDCNTDNLLQKAAQVQKNFLINYFNNFNTI